MAGGSQWDPLFSDASNLPSSVLGAFRCYFSSNVQGNFGIVIYCHFVDEAEAQRGYITCLRPHRCNRSWGCRPFCGPGPCSRHRCACLSPLPPTQPVLCAPRLRHRAAASAPLRATSFVGHILEFSVGVCAKEQGLTVRSDQVIESMPPPLGTDL